jgi:hypothetical protein
VLIKYFEVDKFYGYILNYFICKIYTTMSELTNTDYKKILEFYNKPIPKSKRLLRNQAEKIIVSKLCRCIKKVDKKNESRAIGICTKTIINSKGFTRGKFTCKKRQEINLKKGSNITRKNRK